MLILNKNWIFKKLNFFKYSNSSNQKIHKKDFKELEQADIEYFQQILPSASIILDKFELQPYNRSIFRTHTGFSKVALFPQNSFQISKILRYCNTKNIAIVPQGGNTGLVDGSVPVFDEIILNMKKMNKIYNFNSLSSILTLQAGCTLQKANQYLDQYGFQFPLSLPTKDSCQIGGNAATKAGGIYGIKYGQFRFHILGMQVILSNGQVLNMLSQNQKDNTGYDLKHLFIGSEGTLGIISKMNILCPKHKQTKNILLLKAQNFKIILDWVQIMKQRLNKNINSLQYFDGVSYINSSKYTKMQLMDNVTESEHFLLVQSSIQIGDIAESLSDYSDAILATSQTQCHKIWKVVEGIEYAASKQGRKRTYDVSFDIKRWDELTSYFRKNMPSTLLLSYGHIGDGNLHLSFCHHQPPKIDEQFYSYIADGHGSISASYGVGINKNKFLHLQKSPQVLKAYNSLKNSLDPKGILNPYKLLPF